MYQKISLLACCISFCILFTHTADAISMSNDQYQIQNTQIQIGTGTQFQNTQTAPLPYSITYPYGKAPLTISVDSTVIDYGELHPGEPLLRTLSISLGNTSSFPIELFLAEDHAPQNASDAAQIIPDTRCDSGTCTSYTADDWQNPLTFGFGYRCMSATSMFCMSQFSDPQAYVQFSHKDSAFIEVGSFPSHLQNAHIQLTTQLNISNSLPFGSYRNTLLLINSPKI